MRWYISAAAVREYMAICRWPAASDGPMWDRAERELSDHCDAATLASEDGDRQQWRTGRRRLGDLPQSDRLEMTVVTTPRPEGPLPQLVRVRRKGGSRGGAR